MNVSQVFERYRWTQFVFSIINKFTMQRSRHLFSELMYCFILCIWLRLTVYIRLVVYFMWNVSYLPGSVIWSKNKDSWLWNVHKKRYFLCLWYCICYGIIMYRYVAIDSPMVSTLARVLPRLMKGRVISEYEVVN